METRFMRATFATLAAVALLVSAPVAQTKTAKPAKTLDIYALDVEGGKATLFITPAGESVLIDSANPVARDTDRIMAVLAEAGVKEIDYLISTHYHVDHIGGLQELAKRIPIKHYIDHGPSVEEREQVAGFQAAYAELWAKAKHTVAKPGDKLPVTGVDWRIVTSAGAAIKTALPGGGKPNPACASFEKKNDSPTDDNGQSVGSLITFGKFRMIDLGDLLWNKEYDFMCPNNLVGTVDLYLASHHGLDQSGSPALVHGLQPRVAIQQNGTRKGGTVQTAKTLYSSPGFEDMWQAHWAYNAGIEYNPAGLFIANVDDPAVIAAVLTAPPGGGRGGPPAGGPGGAAPAAPGATAPAAAGAPPAVAAPAGTPPAAAPPAAATPGQPGAPGAGAAPAASAPAPGAAPGGRQGGGGGGRGGPGQPHTGPASWIKVSAQADGTFTVTNSRNGFSRTYKPR
jgi:beta-lactamase superfamily II metal-dependent hydrolase